MYPHSRWHRSLFRIGAFERLPRPGVPVLLFGLALVSTAVASCVQTKDLAEQAGPDLNSVQHQLAGAPKAAITNGIVSATIMLPDAQRGFYRATRFDWSGMISSLKMGETEYYGPWFDGTSETVRDYEFQNGAIIAARNTAALGPAESFDAVTPSGWEAVPAGGGFLKIGVGVLRKPEDQPAYSAFRPYDIIVPGEWSVSTERSQVSFTHEIEDPVSGYGYSYTKSVILVPGRPEMRIEHVLTNTGRNQISTSVFNHNFLTLGAGPDRAGLTIRTPYAISTTRVPAADAAELAGNSLVYRRGLADGEVVSLPVTGYGSGTADSVISVDVASGRGVTIAGDRPLSRVFFWSIRSTLAVEPYVRVEVQPGETTRWSWLYRYR